jgi:hypothetical protein
LDLKAQFPTGKRILEESLLFVIIIFGFLAVWESSIAPGFSPGF